MTPLQPVLTSSTNDMLSSSCHLPRTRRHRHVLIIILVGGVTYTDYLQVFLLGYLGKANPAVFLSYLLEDRIEVPEIGDGGRVITLG